MFRRTLLLFLPAFFLGCEKDVSIEIIDRCPDCIASAKMNDEVWNLEPDAAYFEIRPGSTDSTFNVEFKSYTQYDLVADYIGLFNLPFKEEVILFSDSIMPFQHVGLLVFNGVTGYHAPHDHYTLIPGTGGFIKIDSINSQTKEIELTFEFQLAPDGDSTKTPRTNSYPQLMKITEGRFKGVIRPEY